CHCHTDYHSRNLHCQSWLPIKKQPVQTIFGITIIIQRFKSSCMNSIIEIITYQPEHQPWFEKLNRDWIEKYFWMESIDEQVLKHPDEHIIKKGGMIFMALYQKEMAGTAALKFVEPGVYEFTKMGVAEKFQGKKIGEM